jgi:hypothetical protein
MKVYIFFIVAKASISVFTIPQERPWKGINQEIDPLENQVERFRRHDGNDTIKDELLQLLFNSTYSEKQEFRNEMPTMDPDEKLSMIKNLEWILNGNFYFNQFDDQYDNDNYTLYPYDFYGSNYDLNGNEIDQYNNYNDYFDDGDDDDDDYYPYMKVNLNDFYDAVQWALNKVEEKAIDLVYDLKRELRNNLIDGDFEKLAPMSINERFDLRDDRIMHLNEVLETYQLAIVILVILVLVMVLRLCCMMKKQKLFSERDPMLNSKPKIKIEKIARYETQPSKQENQFQVFEKRSPIDDERRRKTIQFVNMLMQKVVDQKKALKIGENTMLCYKHEPQSKV